MSIRTRSVRFGLMLSAASLIAAVGHAAAPPAGFKIGNQASATYTNASGDTISVTSNKVETVVQQVAGLTLLADNAEGVAPGGKVFLPHTLTNEGNGTDSFTLTATEDAGGPFDFTDITIYADANFDGVADSTTPITATPNLSAGESYGIVIEATVPAGAGDGQTETIEVNAISVFDGSVATAPTAASGLKTNVNTITISSGPVTEVVKSMVVTEGSGDAADGLTGPGDIVTVTLTYSSTGLSAANNMVVTDALSQYLSYDTTTAAIWSDSATGLDNADDGPELTNGSGNSIDYSYDATATATVSGTVAFTISQVPTGRTGSVTFRAVIADDAPAGAITNIATQTVEIGGVPTAFPPSNEATVTVDPVYRVTAADAPATEYRAGGDTGGVTGNLTAAGASTTDDDGAQDDVVTESSNIFQGGSVTMEFVITNHANVADPIDVSIANDAVNGFPAGTTFRIVASDGATPVVGPVGPLAAGDSTTVSVIATLPANATPTAAGDTNYALALTAQSANGGPTNDVTGRFTGAVLGTTVDLENANGTGDGPDPVGSPTQVTTATNPGEPVTFPMIVQNSGPTAETYDLSLPTPLPAGWTVRFELPDGTPITNTGVIPGNGQQNIVVVVTPPADALPGDTPVQVAVVSPTSGQGDTLTDTVTVNQIIDVSLTTDQAVQGAPGGVIDVPHVLTNEGNVAITEGAIGPVGTFSTFAGALFWDVNGDRVLDGGDVVIDNIADVTGGLPVGGIISVIHRIQVPSNGAVGYSETETLTLETALNGPDEATAGTAIDSDPSNNSVDDTVVVFSGDMVLSKKQALDADCNGGEPASAFTAGNVSAKPGQCIRYEITASNTGTDNASTVTIRDTVPAYTTLTECPSGGSSQCAVIVSPGGSSVTAQPAEGNGGSLESTHGTLIPGAPASLSFTVKIDE